MAARSRFSSMSEAFPEQMRVVLDTVVAGGVFDRAAVMSQLHEFYNLLELPRHYFDSTPPETIAKHIQCFLAGKVLAKNAGRPMDLTLRHEADESAMFVARSSIRSLEDGSVTKAKGEDATGSAESVETYIESRYLTPASVAVSIANEDLAGATIPSTSLSMPTTSAGTTGSIWRLQCFRSGGMLQDEKGSAGEKFPLRLYFLEAPRFVNATPAAEETRIEELADERFLRSSSKRLQELYQRVVTEASSKLGPAIHTEFIVGGDEDLFADASAAPASGSGHADPVPRSTTPDADATVLLLVAHRAGSTHSFFRGLADVYRWHHLYATRKYVEPFSNGVVVYAFYLRPLHDDKVLTAAPVVSLREHVTQMVRDASLHFVLPRTSITPLLTHGRLSAQEVAYAYAAWKFAYHFLSRGVEEFAVLTRALAGMPDELAALQRMRRSMRTHAFTEGAILDTIYRNPSIVARLYADFALRLMPGRERSPSELLTQSALRRLCSSDTDVQTFTAFLHFNAHILKTNFYKREITALAFRMDPAFLNPAEYPLKPFGIFYTVGAEFRGFHIRFADIARGGIRVVRSANTQAFAQNVATVFDEGYGLSSTQQKKNKDIPEGGSKGIVLLNMGHTDKTEVAFKKFCDAILDLILVDTSAASAASGATALVAAGGAGGGGGGGGSASAAASAVSASLVPAVDGDEIVDYYGRPEILFFGPDENTANLMDWACDWARKRGYSYWKAFTTGKAPSRGGLPHDEYGMTTHSVRAFAEGIQRELGLVGAECTKVQTGGPDGDLGSNEIKYGNEKTLAIVDGSGVLFDPLGIHATELRRLADNRLMVKCFDVSKLSEGGYLVLVEEKDRRLPDGTVVESGMDFRNLFHFNPAVTADFFIPCGGRPAAVTPDNVDKFLWSDGVGGKGARPRFKYVVEGANLFFTQEARLRVEAAGIPVIKDASANKGGVTCSSLEVLAALALTDDEHRTHMCASGHDLPAFYQRYVREVQKSIIPLNAELEFSCLWREHKRTGKPFSELTDLLSTKITDLSSRIEESDSLWNNLTLRRAVLQSAIPTTLAELLGGAEVVVSRLPENYLRALFGARLASRFIYGAGLGTPEFAFFEYVDGLLH